MARPRRRRRREKTEPTALARYMALPAEEQATPTIVRWQLEEFADEVGVFGVEEAQLDEHRDRVAGKMILDAGEWRERRFIWVPLTTDPDRLEELVRKHRRPVRVRTVS